MKYSPYLRVALMILVFQQVFVKIIEAQTKPDSLKSTIKPYKDIITEKAVTRTGLFIVHQVENKYYLELSDSVLDRELLLVTRLAKSSAGTRTLTLGYAGDEVNNGVIRFEMGPNNKIFLRKLSFNESSKDSTQPMFRAVSNSNMQPIVAAFEIKTIHPDSKAPVIDFTEYLNGDNDILFFESGTKSSLRLATLQPDRSYITGINTYPLNTEIKTVKTYLKSAAGTGGGQSGGVATVELNTSMILLPKEPMIPRYVDNRVGYFTTQFIDYDKDPQGVEYVVMIKRWRLEPRQEDLAKYYNGELVEPKKQIVFYIDPATPKKWVPYLIQGVNDWSVAFEQAGFKNAIIGKEAPTKAEDSTWSLEDARFSAIVYKPSTIPNASGPSIADPRSGEILESHVNWYHNVMELLRNWYFIQTAAVDSQARSMQFSDELMGQLIRFVASHEIGHTLGLRHNFGASSSVPVEKLRDKKWLQENSHSPSIMDYARFNYVAQPEDGISQEGLMPRIGKYDKWAIEWGYKLFPGLSDPEKEIPLLNKLTIEKSNEGVYWFGAETDQNDPRSQDEDLGDNAMNAGEYGIRNLKRIITNLTKWTRVPNEDYGNLAVMYNEAMNQMNRYIRHVIKNIGGIYQTPKTIEQEGVVFEIVPGKKQKEAVQFLKTHVFTTPNWLINTQITSQTGINPVEAIRQIHDKALNDLLNTERLERLIAAEAQNAISAYPLSEYIKDLRESIFAELGSVKTIELYRRNLQKIFVDKLIAIVGPPPAGPQPLGGILPRNFSNVKSNDIFSIVRGTLRAIKKQCDTSIPLITNNLVKYHLEDIRDRIIAVLDSK